LIYSFHIYSWPSSLLQKMDKWIWNFIWSGDVNTRKLCTVSSAKLCLPYEAGGLEIRSLQHFNTSLMMHLCWKFLSSNDDWARLCRARFLRSGVPTATYIRSSVWFGIKQHITTITDNSRWLIGTGDNIYFWTDNWLGDKLSDLLSIPTLLLP
jgi:hypothetical protein